MSVSCQVILDLIPLVKDNVASEESNVLVLEHIYECECCRLEFENYNVETLDSLNDKKIIASIKRRLLVIGIIILIAGSLIGVALTNSFGILYNFLIMPVIGASGYMTLKRKWYLVPAGIFMLSYLWIFINGILSDGFTIEALYYPVYLSIMYAFLVLLGTLIARLLSFALKKEV